MRIALMAGLTATGALIAIPVGPVPITLQIFFTLLAGMVLGSKDGALSQLVYILIGAMGLPVFSGFQGGLGVLIGPTGGYLFGFIVAAFVVGKIIERTQQLCFLNSMIALGFGIVVIYALGVGQLMLILKLPLLQAVTVGAMPFILPDIGKAFGAAIIGLRLRNVLHNYPKGK